MRDMSLEVSRHRDGRGYGPKGHSRLLACAQAGAGRETTLGRGYSVRKGRRGLNREGEQVPRP